MKPVSRMTATTPTTDSLVDLAYQKLRQRILDNEWPPGARALEQEPDSPVVFCRMARVFFLAGMYGGRTKTFGFTNFACLPIAGLLAKTHALCR